MNDIEIEVVAHGVYRHGEIEPQFEIGSVSPEGAKVPTVMAKISRALNDQGISEADYRNRLNEIDDDKTLDQPQCRVGTVVIDRGTYEVKAVSDTELPA